MYKENNLQRTDILMLYGLISRARTVFFQAAYWEPETSCCWIELKVKRWLWSGFQRFSEEMIYIIRITFTDVGYGIGWSSTCSICRIELHDGNRALSGYLMIFLYSVWQFNTDNGIDGARAHEVGNGLSMNVANNSEPEW